MEYIVQNSMEQDGNVRNNTGSYSIIQVRAQLTPTLTHVVVYELATSGAEDNAMSTALSSHLPTQLHLAREQP